jgi:hypothetical protein
MPRDGARGARCLECMERPSGATRRRPHPVNIRRALPVPRVARWHKSRTAGDHGTRRTAHALPQRHGTVRRRDRRRRSRGALGRDLARPLPAPGRAHRLGRPAQLGDARHQRLPRAAGDQARGAAPRRPRRVQALRRGARGRLRGAGAAGGRRALRARVRPAGDHQGGGEPPRPRDAAPARGQRRRRVRADRRAARPPGHRPQGRVAAHRGARAGVRRPRARLPRLRRLRHPRPQDGR